MPGFTGSTHPPHGERVPTGILVTNLGTPDAPTTEALRRYLAEFLNDRRVIETPRIIWWPVLYGIILQLRPRRSAKAYKKIWTEQGSPLRAISLRQTAAIAEHLKARYPGPLYVEPAMRYGNPSVRSALEKMHAAGIRRLLVFPLYPQYSATTTASTFDAVVNVLKTWRWIPEFRMITHYHDDAGYIAAVAESIRKHRAEHGIPDKLLFSFHGLPKKYFAAGDPYYCECRKTARLVAAMLGLENDHWTVAFQSRFGPMEWLKPYTDEVLQDWARSGHSNVHIICPGFAADCLETLEEIQMQSRRVFLAAGGKQFSYIPALNEDPAHIEALANIILKNCRDWEGRTFTSPPDY